MDPKEEELKKKELRLSFWTNTILVGVLGGIATVSFYLIETSQKQSELLLRADQFNLNHGELEFKIIDIPMQKIIDDPCSSEAEKADKYLNVILSAQILRDETAGKYDQIVRSLRQTCVVSPPTSNETCSDFKHLRELGWSSGHKNNFCITRGYSGVWNFPGSSYSSGGFCYSGALSACASAITSSATPR